MSKEKIKYFSEYDAMTGVLNRRAGFELLNKIYRDFMKDKGKVSICFSDIVQAESIWNRIHDDFRKINEMENRKYIISASHGIEEFKFNSDEYIDEIINLADEKMYNEKRIIEKDFKAIRKK